MSPTPSGQPSAPRAAREAAAQARAEERARRQRERRVRITAIVVVAVLVVAGIVVSVLRSRPDASAATPIGVSKPGGPIVLGPGVSGGGAASNATGSPGAVPVLDIWEDFQCPYCQEFEQANRTVIGSYLSRDQLTVRYHLVSFLGPESVRAANAAGCAAGAKRFPAYHAALYENQPPEGTGGYTIDELLRIGRTVGLTSADFTTCVRDQRYDGWVQAVQHAFDTAGMRGTPSVFLDGQLLNADQIRPDAFAALLRTAVAGK